jgi:hypothetical protein
MKLKSTFFLLLFAGMIFFFTSCEDDNELFGECQVCTYNNMGTPNDIEYCDNGDGTIEVSENGTTETQTLGGVSFEQFIASQVQIGASCN